MNQYLFGITLSQVMPTVVASGLFVSSCTIQAPSGAYGPSGAPDNAYVDVAGLVGIQCMDAPESWGPALAATENPAIPNIESESFRHVLLDRFYSELSPGTNWGNVGWRAIVDGTTYDLAAAEADSQRTQTRLKLKAITV